jgi:hypothetical protein
MCLAQIRIIRRIIDLLNCVYSDPSGICTFKSINLNVKAPFLVYIFIANRYRTRRPVMPALEQTMNRVAVMIMVTHATEQIPHQLPPVTVIEGNVYVPGSRFSVQLEDQTMP